MLDRSEAGIALQCDSSSRRGRHLEAQSQRTSIAILERNRKAPVQLNLPPPCVTDLGSSCALASAPIAKRAACATRDGFGQCVCDPESRVLRRRSIVVRSRYRLQGQHTHSDKPR